MLAFDPLLSFIIEILLELMETSLRLDESYVAGMFSKLLWFPRAMLLRPWLPKSLMEAW